jgi:hypothetical protein
VVVVLPLLLDDAPPAPPLEGDPPSPLVLLDEEDPPVLPLLEAVLPLLEDDASVPLDVAFTEHPDAAAAAVRRRESKD